MNYREREPYIWIGGAIWIAVIVIDTWGTVSALNAGRVTGSLENFGIDSFFIGYVSLVALSVTLLTKIKDRVFRRVLLGFYGTIAISFFMLTVQVINDESSFTVATFLYPVIAMFYIMHSNPYDVKSGSLDGRSFEDQINTYYDKKQEFLFMSLYIRGAEDEGINSSDEVTALIRKYCVSAFRRATLFAVDKNQMIMIVPVKQNPDYRERINLVMERFNIEYERLKRDYKVVIGKSIDFLSEHNEYLSFINSIHRSMPDNTMHIVDEEDLARYERSRLIRSELEDIHKKGDPDDPRVLCYCQPVLNIGTGKYDTAEALMRLEIEGIGIVPPDQFIPVAEEHMYIHSLTKIILHKVCAQVKRLAEAGYALSRVSVNISAIELNAEDFCEDISGIIDANGLSGDSIAIELTESRSERDFEIMKEKINELKEKGIIFYLDDFGTGYSNMERIMELPFDIIKFDRSMLLESEANERSRKIVSSLAKMFADMNYSVLYEGVEQDSEEKMCIDMDASYLQGFKYSKPIPIEDLGGYLDRHLS